MDYYREEERYPWFFFNKSPKRMISLTVTVLVLIGLTIFYFWYSGASIDPTPDSIVGYSFATAGTIFALLAGLRFSLYRRSRGRRVGELNNSLNWHISLAVIAFALLLFHSFGHFNPRSGTFALYGMIALVVTGIIGRALDKMGPRMITQQVNKALDNRGEDRVESVSRELRSIVAHNEQDVRGFNVNNGAGRKRSGRAAASVGAAAGRNQALQTPWDMAYISMEELPQEVERDSAQYRFVPDRRSDLARPGALMPGVRDHLQELQQVERALQREQFYRYLIRYWRIFHILVAVVTLGLTLWHLEFATTLLMPLIFKHYNLLHLWFQ
jgi:lipopolysaccharide export LptBFGC system permease protein LptF